MSKFFERHFTKGMFNILIFRGGGMAAGRVYIMPLCYRIANVCVSFFFQKNPNLQFNQPIRKRWLLHIIFLSRLSMFYDRPNYNTFPFSPLSLKCRGIKEKRKGTMFFSFFLMAASIVESSGLKIFV